jgi:hypothetical protein
MMAATAYVVLVVLANFGIIPFSGIVMKPWRWLAALLSRVLVYL